MIDVASAPADRRLELPLEPRDQEGAAVSLELAAGRPGAERLSAIRIMVPGAAQPRILLATRPTAGRSVVEALYPVERVALAELGAAGIYDYQLVALDGPKLTERGAGSVMLVVDSPDIGIPGDAVALERILPVDLSRRSLARLPDMALAPLGWAAFIIIAAGIDDALDAYASALPFSAYAVAVLADEPHLVAPALSGDIKTGAARWRRRSSLLAAILASWLPGYAAAAAAGPWSGVAIAILTMLVALYIRARSSR